LADTAYRDRGDEYFVKVISAHGRIDSTMAIYATSQQKGRGRTVKRMKLSADQSRRCQWSQDRNFLKIIFFWGAMRPPHLYYVDCHIS